MRKSIKINEDKSINRLFITIVNVVIDKYQMCIRDRNKTLAKISPASYNALEQRVDTLEAQNKKLQETVDMLVQKLNEK